MTEDGIRDERTATAVLEASTELLERLNASASPLSIVSESLAGLAATLGVEQAIVAIDDAEYGRQVFCSGRALLGDRGDMLWGPPRVCTDPPRVIDDSMGRLIVAAVTTTFERARAATVERASSLTPEPVSKNSQLVGRPDELITGLAAATARSARYGWGFTLVLIRLDEGDDQTRERVEAHLRESDTLIEMGPRDLGLLLAAARSDEVPTILARVGRGGTVSTFCYGLATCPGDSAEASELLALATARLRDAESTRRAPENSIHALEAPKV